MPISKKAYKKSRGRGRSKRKRKSKVVPNYLLIIIDILDNQNLQGENLEYYLSLRQQLLAKPKKVNLIIHKLLKKKEFKHSVPAIIGMNGGGGKKGKSTRREPSKKMRKFHGKYGIAAAREACKEYRGNPRTQCLKSYRNGLLTRCPYNWKNSEGYKQCQDMYSNLIGLSGPQAYRPLPNGPVVRPEQGRYFLKQNPKGPQKPPPKGHVYESVEEYYVPQAWHVELNKPYVIEYPGRLIGESAGLKPNKLDPIRQRVPTGQPTAGPSALKPPTLAPFNYVQYPPQYFKPGASSELNLPRPNLTYSKPNVTLEPSNYVQYPPQYIGQGMLPKPNATYPKPNITSGPLGSNKIQAGNADLVVPSTALLLYLISIFANRKKKKTYTRITRRRRRNNQNNHQNNGNNSSTKPKSRNTERLRGPHPLAKGKSRTKLIGPHPLAKGKYRNTKSNHLKGPHPLAKGKSRNIKSNHLKGPHPQAPSKHKKKKKKKYKTKEDKININLITKNNNSKQIKNNTKKISNQEINNLIAIIKSQKMTNNNRFKSTAQNSKSLTLPISTNTMTDFPESATTHNTSSIPLKNTGPKTDTKSLTKFKVGDTINYTDSLGQDVSAPIIEVEQADEHRVKTSSKPRQGPEPPKSPSTINIDFPPAPPEPSHISLSSSNIDVPTQSQNINPRLNHEIVMTSLRKKSLKNAINPKNLNNLIKRSQELIKSTKSKKNNSRNISQAIRYANQVLEKSKRFI